MTHDTSGDPRLLMAEVALKKLRKTLQHKLGIRPKLSKDETDELLRTIEGNLKAARYMFLEPSDLADQEAIREIVECTRRVLDSVGEALECEQTLATARADLFWIFQVLIALPGRLKRGGETKASGVDLMVVKVRNVVRKGDLWVTKVDNGRRELTVVTNLPEVESGMKLGAAFLPPVQLAETVSEAMFLGSGERSEDVGTFLRDDEVDVKEAAGIAHRTVNEDGI